MPKSADARGQRHRPKRWPVQISVKYQPAVGIGHCLRDFEEEFQSRPQVERMVAAVDIDGLVDVLHRDVRTTVLIDAGVIQARDVRVFEQRTDVTLARHAFAETRGPGEARQFERNLAFVAAIGALGQPYTAHAAAADLVQQSIRTNALAADATASSEPRFDSDGNSVVPLPLSA